MSELAVELALLSSTAGFSTSSCVALGTFWNLSEPEFPHQENGGFVPTAITAFW